MSSTRQIHLDFHCSEHIKSIGESYDKKTFQKRLSEAKVNSINLFDKCHHSWSYYPTIIGKTHPHLKDIGNLELLNYPQRVGINF